MADDLRIAKKQRMEDLRAMSPSLAPSLTSLTSLVISNTFLPEGAVDEDHTSLTLNYCTNVQKFLESYPARANLKSLLISGPRYAYISHDYDEIEMRFAPFERVKDTLDLSKIQSLTGLTSLAITARNVIGVTSGALSAFTSLTSLTMSNHRRSDNEFDSDDENENDEYKDEDEYEDEDDWLQFMKVLTSLKSLDLSFSRGGLSTLRGLECVTSLTSLNISHCSIKSLRPLAACTALTSLNASNNKELKELGPLGSCTALEALDVGHTKVEWLGALASCCALTRLDVSFTRVNDLTPLKAITALKIDVGYTPAWDAAVAEAEGTSIKRIGGYSSE